MPPDRRSDGVPGLLLVSQGPAGGDRLPVQLL